MIALATMALRNGLRQILLADANLVTRLGGSGKVYDEAPRNADTPYIALGDVRTSDWSASDNAGCEHTLILEVWSKHNGVAECLEIAALVEHALATHPDALAGYNLVLLRHESTETSRRDRGRLSLCRMRYRALTDDL